MPCSNSVWRHSTRHTQRRRVRWARPSGEYLERRDLLALVVWDGGPRGTGTDWNDVQNWSTDTLPTAADDVEIGAKFRGLTISHDGGSTRIRSLHSAANLTISRGTFSIDGDSQITGTLTLGGGSLSGSGALQVSSMAWTGGTLTGSGTTTVGALVAGKPQGQLSLSGQAKLLSGSHQLISEAEAVWTAGGFDLGELQSPRFINRGSFLVQDNLAMTSGRGATEGRFVNQGTFTVNVSGEMTSSVPLDNSGDLIVSAGTFHVSRPLVQTDGTIRLEGGQLRISSRFDLRGGRLEGSGSIVGNVNHLGGTVAPGNPIGTLAIKGNYLQGSGGTLETTLGGAAPGTGYDQLQVTGQTNLAGTLRVNTANAFLPQDGSIVVPITYGFAPGSLPYCRASVWI